MIKIGYEQKLPFMYNLENEIARVEHRIGKKVRDHLGFGDEALIPLRYAFKNGQHLIGELDSNDNLCGRGITIQSLGSIHINYNDSEGCSAPGNYIYIFEKGDFLVGERYLENGNIKARGTRYNSDWSVHKYDD